MLGEGGTALSRLQVAVREFQARDELPVDNQQLRAVIDALEGEFSANARRSQRNGEHLAGGNITAASWIARTCDTAVPRVAERLWGGAQLESGPRVAAALASGEVGYQSVAVLAHLRDKLGE